MGEVRGGRGEVASSKNWGANVFDFLAQNLALSPATQLDRICAVSPTANRQPSGSTCTQSTRKSIPLIIIKQSGNNEARQHNRYTLCRRRCCHVCAERPGEGDHKNMTVALVNTTNQTNSTGENQTIHSIERRTTHVYTEEVPPQRSTFYRKTPCHTNLGVVKKRVESAEVNTRAKSSCGKTGYE